MKWDIFKLGMAMGQVRAGFLYAQTRPAGLNPLPEPTSFNKRVFFQTPNPPHRALQAPRALSRPTHPQITTQTQISKPQVSNL